MPKAQSRKEPGKIALDKESLSSASQLAHFGVRLAKFTHSIAQDTNADFASGYELPANAAVISVVASVEEAYDGTGTATVAGQALTLTSTGVSGATPAAPAASAGEITVDFTANDSTTGKATIAVAYIDLSELN